MRYVDMLTILDKFLEKVERHNKIVEDMKAKQPGGRGKATKSNTRKRK